MIPEQSMGLIKIDDDEAVGRMLADFLDKRPSGLGHIFFSYCPPDTVCIMWLGLGLRRDASDP